MFLFFGFNQALGPFFDLELISMVCFDLRIRSEVRVFQWSLLPIVIIVSSHVDLPIQAPSCRVPQLPACKAGGDCVDNHQPLPWTISQYGHVLAHEWSIMSAAT